MSARSEIAAHDLVDAVAKLTQPYRLHRTRPELDRNAKGTATRLEFVSERVALPSLLDQLAESQIPTASGERGGKSSGNRPPITLEATDCLATIERETSRWRNRLDVAPTGDLADDLRLLVATALARIGLTMTTGTIKALAKDAVGWYGYALTVTGWDEQPFRPHSMCPGCGSIGGLRVKLSAKAARCQTCSAQWISPAEWDDLVTFVALGIAAQRSSKVLAETIHATVSNTA